MLLCGTADTKTTGVAPRQVACYKICTVRLNLPQGASSDVDTDEADAAAASLPPSQRASAKVNARAFPRPFCLCRRVREHKLAVLICATNTASGLLLLHQMSPVDMCSWLQIKAHA